MRILAHRGASGYAPENTFAAFELGARQGADAIETDVRMTRDGVLVLIHDSSVDRTTTGRGAVAGMDYAEVARLDAGVKFDAKFKGEKVPRLADFLESFGGRMAMCLELKVAGAVEEVVRLVNGTEGVEFTSFEWGIAVRLKEMLPGAAIGHLTRGFDLAEIERVRAAGLTSICPPAKDVRAEFVAAAHAAGLLVRTWGTKTQEQLKHIRECGVDGTTLNHPDWFVRE